MIQFEDLLKFNNVLNLSIILNHHGIVDVKMLILVVKHLNQSELFDGGDMKIEERV